MLNINDVMKKLNASFLKGAKTPHGMSNPIVKEMNGVYYIAVFVYSYTRQNIQYNQLPRPSFWVLADMESGEKIEEISCNERDFSKEPFDALYEMKYEQDKRPTKNEMLESYRVFDKIREGVLANNQLDQEKYAEYFQSILKATPLEYRRFYKELGETL